MDAAHTRNIAFVGHPSSGKTTLVDALAFLTGATDRQGSVAEKTSICDTEPEEQDKQHTLQLSVVHAEKEGVAWNFFDTPGYPDFVGETNSGMFAADLVMGTVSCSSGVTFNLMKKMGAAKSLNRGRAIVITHIDGDNADFEELVLTLRDKISETCVPVLLPNENGGGFSAVTKVIDHDSDWHKRLFDRVMDACEDEKLLNDYLETESLTVEQLDEHMPHAVARGALIPVLACNPVTGVGVPEVLDFLRHFAPHPTDGAVFTADGEVVELDPEADLLGVVFNVRADPHVGKICTARILRGTLKASDSIAVDGEKGEKVGGLFHLVGGKKRDSIESAGPGDIVAFSKVEKIPCWGSFGIAGSESVRKVESPPSAVPMVSLAVFPKSRADEQKIGEALHKLEAEDVTFRTLHDPLTHELVMCGMSDLHLQMMEARLKRRFGVEIETKLPRIAYQESVTKPSDGHHRHKKQSGGRGQFGECYIRMKPGAKGSGITFHDKVVGGSIPRNLIPAVEKGVRAVCDEGVLTHSKVVDLEVELYDGKFHAVDSDEASFKAAGARAFKDAFSKGRPVLLEPVMAVDIHVGSDHAGTIFSDITSHRRGHVTEQDTEEGITVIKAHVPLSTMQTYHRDLKSQTSGEGSYSMELDHYAPMPKDEQERVIRELAKQEQEE